MSDKRLLEGLDLNECVEIRESSLATDKEIQYITQSQQVASQKLSDQVESPKKSILSKPKRILTDQYTEEINQDNQNEKPQSKRSKLQTQYDHNAQQLTTEPQKIQSKPEHATGRKLFVDNSLFAGQSSLARTNLTYPSPGNFLSNSKNELVEPEIQSSTSISTSPRRERKIKALFEGDVDGDTPLHIAIVHNHPLTRTFIDNMILYGKKYPSYGLDIPNVLKQTVLHLAVLTCQPSVVEYLVEKGADVNITDRNGQTALHLACKNADLEDVKALRHGMKKNKENSIDLNLRNFEGLAVIHLATLTGSCEVLGELLDMGANIDVKDSASGRTSLHHAVEAHNPIIVGFLLTRNADVNAQTFSGNTPLHTASGRHMEGIIRLLLEFGANVQLKNSEGDLSLPETHRLYSLAQRSTKAHFQEKKTTS